MSGLVDNMRRVGLMVCLLVGAGLACNARGATPTNLPTAANTATVTVEIPQSTVSAPETVPALVASSTAATSGKEILPTFTPIQPPTLASTLTPSNTPNPKPTTSIGETASKTPKATSTLPESVGKLTLEYHISWRLKDASTKQAVATVTLTARGGGGDYQYYRDELEVDGPIFEYEWRTCTGNPGSFRVTSADGQSAKIDYFEHPPCPTATPEP